MKNTGCVGCHQLGQASTRTIPPALGTFASGAEAWKRRVQSGQSGAADDRPAERTRRGGVRQLRRLDRPHRQGRAAVRQAAAAAGRRAQHRRHAARLDERQAVPARPDRQRPALSHGERLRPALSDRPSTAPTRCRFSIRSRTWPRRSSPRCATPSMPLSLGPGHAAALDALQPSPYWGDERIWDTQRQQPQLDVRTRRAACGWPPPVRANDNPAFCKQGSDHPSAKAFPMERATRHVAVFDPKTKKYTFVDTCFSTHHLQFGYDANDTLWTSGGGPVVGWINTQDVRRDRRRGASRRAGRRWCSTPTATASATPTSSPDQPVDPDQGQAHQRGVLRGDAEPGGRLGVGLGAGRARRRGAALAGREPAGDGARRDLQRADARLRRRAAPTSTSNGVVWVSLGSGHIGSFDRRKCKGPLNGPKATGDHCPEGWAFHQYPGSGLPGHRRRTAPSRATTPGSTSTTRSASARTCRCRPAT